MPRDLDPAARRLVDQATEQGHPERITDTATISTVAALVRQGVPHAPAA